MFIFMRNDLKIPMGQSDSDGATHIGIGCGQDIECLGGFFIFVTILLFYFYCRFLFLALKALRLFAWKGWKYTLRGI